MSCYVRSIVHCTGAQKDLLVGLYCEKKEPAGKLNIFLIIMTSTKWRLNCFISIQVSQELNRKLAYSEIGTAISIGTLYGPNNRGDPFRLHAPLSSFYQNEWGSVLEHSELLNKATKEKGEVVAN